VSFRVLRVDKHYGLLNYVHTEIIGWNIKGWEMSYWETQRAVDTAGLVDNLVQIGAHMREKRELDRAEKAYQEGYARALEDAKRTGQMPAEYQRHVMVDEFARHVGIKVVALRELAKLDPKHPLLNQTVRNNIATQTVINFCKHERPADAGLGDYAPSDSAAQKIYDHTLGRKAVPPANAAPPRDWFDDYLSGKISATAPAEEAAQQEVKQK